MNALNKPVLNNLLPIIRGEYKFNYNLAHLTWFKVGGDAEIFFKPKDSDDLIYFLQQNMKKLPVTVIGAGSNLLIRDGGIKGVVIKLGRNFTDITYNDNELIVQAGCLNYNLAKFCQQNNIKDFEFLVGIPGTVGGGIAMNAGAYGREFKDIVLKIEAVDLDGNIKIFNLNEIGFKYRHNSLPQNLIFTKIYFKFDLGDKEIIANKMKEINELRGKTQPIKEKTCGSTFANQPNVKVWQLIDQVSMRGYTHGGAQVSELHCNFLINKGNATAQDIEEIGEIIKARVKEKFTIDLNWEIKRFGENK